eukprot:Blabericola_migrator_1__6413@NODE_3233_length_1927_cov_36_120968_g2025_i0_p1_GENE_NODE_3233_length_1927_cov_36_120968_g2025_i0NODE_3233_length_1927_cov_36_120968_g2025_i0_p1_ORF_typecomplete_len410_score59_34FleQ/PF06490_11/8_8FleQ/PF06490_11/37_NODE_3233_length_1927_cov_36_120968_g2025_i03181547
MTRSLSTTDSSNSKFDAKPALIAIASGLVPNICQGELVVANVLEGVTMKEDPSVNTLMRHLLEGTQGLPKVAVRPKPIDVAIDNVVDHLIDHPVSHTARVDALAEMKLPKLLLDVEYVGKSLYSKKASVPRTPKPNLLSVKVPADAFTESVDLERPSSSLVDFRQNPYVHELYNIRSRESRLAYLKSLNPERLYKIALLTPTYDSAEVAALSIERLFHAGLLPCMSLYHFRDSDVAEVYSYGGMDKSAHPELAVFFKDGSYRDANLPQNLTKGAVMELNAAGSKADIFTAIAIGMYRQGLSELHPVQLANILRLGCAHHVDGRQSARTPNLSSELQLKAIADAVEKYEELLTIAIEKADKPSQQLTEIKTQGQVIPLPVIEDALTNNKFCSRTKVPITVSHFAYLEQNV